jgi:hypothetical protein
MSISLVNRLKSYRPQDKEAHAQPFVVGQRARLSEQAIFCGRTAPTGGRGRLPAFSYRVGTVRPTAGESTPTHHDREKDS